METDKGWGAVVVISDHRTRYPLTIGRYATEEEAAEAAAYAAGGGRVVCPPDYSVRLAHTK
jgi:hypothetical protein